MKNYVLTFLLLGNAMFVDAQNFTYNIKRISEKIEIDGILDEPAWQKTETADNFTQYFPSDSVQANSQSEVRLMYDDQFLYFSARMENLTDDRKYIVNSLRRDFRGRAIDGISLIFDTFQDNTNAFQFGVNSFGVQREGLVSGGFGGTSWSWDNKWYAEAKQYDGYWVAEGAIPFKTLRFKEGEDQWNINFYRIDSEEGERSTWHPIPRNQSLNSVAFTGTLQWDEPLKKTGPNISLIPYTAFDVTRDFTNETETKSQSNISYGGDAKIAIGSGLNLDLTINPDFSQVEVDQQVTNLDRFELFFPEKRQFFLENADLFSNFGHPFYAKSFFSRRIGIVDDTINDQTIQNKILYGARLSGKLDNNWRIGLLNMQTEGIEEINLPSFNYSVGVLQRKVFARSNVGMIFVNKQSFDSPTDNVNFDPSHYNRVLGFDYNIASADNKWIGKVMYQKSWDNQRDPDEYAHMGWIAYRSQTWEWSWAHTIVGENFNAEVGFVPRKGIYRTQTEAGHNFYPASSVINNHKVEGEAEFFWRKHPVTLDLIKSDHKLAIKEGINFQNTSALRFSIQQQYTYLIDSFDPTGSGGEELSADTDYTYHFMRVNYRSDTRRLFTYQASAQFGQYFNGYRYRLSGNITYRLIPYALINFNLTYNWLKMPSPYRDANLPLIGSRIDITMSKKLFFTSFLQYNTQAENFNINTRLQWRFKPVSDLFIVYTDNYGTEGLEGNSDLYPKNRALVIKLTYWLNI